MSQTCDILRFERRMKDDSTCKERNGKIDQSSSKIIVNLLKNNSEIADNWKWKFYVLKCHQ